jgi:hypothetical protein
MPSKPFSADEPVPRKRRRPKRLRAAPRPALTVSQILEWADAHHARTGEWPNASTGWVDANHNEKWHNIDNALRDGYRCLPRLGGLARLLNEKRNAGIRLRPPPLTEAQILEWADAHHARSGRWPNADAGSVPENRDETWGNINQALRLGLRGLPRGGSLARLLTERRGARFKQAPPPLTEDEILEWADTHHQRTSAWPSCRDGIVVGLNGETWGAIDVALHNGSRGLPGNSSLAQLLALHRGKRNKQRLAPLTIEQILAWADAHKTATGRWPLSQSGPVAGSDGETWLGIDVALKAGLRSLPGGSSLPRLLQENRGRRNHLNRPALSVEQILGWADAHFRRTGSWPTVHSGLIEESDGDSWMAIHHALVRGGRGLRGGSSLARLLEKHRGRRNLHHRPALTVKQILKWADAHFRRTGRWPTCGSGPVTEAPDEVWGTISMALTIGRRGLRGGTSLARLLEKHRGRRNHQNLPALTVKQILKWADAHFRRTGRWPNAHSGPVADAPGESWSIIDHVLTIGSRGLDGGSSLFRLLVQHGRKPPTRGNNR